MNTWTLYTVQAGDTPEDIAARTGTTVQTLARMNGLRAPCRLYPNQRLRVPVPCPPPRDEPRGQRYTVQAGDTLGDIAFRFGTTVPVLLRRNRLEDSDVLQVGQELWIPTPSAADTRYEVQVGDTLWRIAEEAGTTVEELVRLNDIRTPHLIFPGERLRLP